MLGAGGGGVPGAKPGLGVELGGWALKARVRAADSELDDAMGWDARAGVRSARPQRRPRAATWDAATRERGPLRSDGSSGRAGSPRSVTSPAGACTGAAVGA